MPKIPDASQLGGRPQLSPRSVITTPDNSSLFRAAENRGKVISGIGSMMSDEIIKRNKQKEDDQNKLQMAIAESNLVKKQLDFESSLEGNDDYTNYEKNFNEFSAAAKSEIIQGITDPKARELFSVNVDNNFARQQARVKEMAFKKQGEYSISAVNQTIENNKSLYAATKDPSYRQRLLESSVAAIDRLRPFVGPVDRDKSRRVAAEGFAEITLMEMSPKDRIAALSSKTTKVSGQAPKDRDEAIKFLIDRFEGESFVASDGKRGASKFGINAQANGLTNEQVESLTREDAESIYRTDYWKKINADSLPENIRFLAFDTAVNFGPPQAKEWLAKSGNDPEKLLELREKTHKELAEKEPEVYGKYQKSWGNRNETVRRLTIGEERTGTIVDALPFDKRIKMVEQAQEEIGKNESDRVATNAFNKALEKGSMSDGLSYIRANAAPEYQSEATSKFENMYGANEKAKKESQDAAGEELRKLIAGGKRFGDIKAENPSLVEKAGFENEQKARAYMPSAEPYDYVNTKIAILSGEQVDLDKNWHLYGDKYEELKTLQQSVSDKTLRPYGEYINQGLLMIGITDAQQKRSKDVAQKAVLFTDKFNEEVSLFKMENKRSPNDKELSGIRDRLIINGKYKGRGMSGGEKEVSGLFYQAPDQKTFIPDMPDAGIRAAVKKKLINEKADYDDAYYSDKGYPTESAIANVYGEMRMDGMSDREIMVKYGR